ncbi:hypothetical protein CCAX7_65770 [Capsulimonas corticalis]|uniref:Uncharacterized protein n=1 Tax=Capsulimonas corticalis TaxID=2219043 RepID=A0A402CQY0_9BACT|nr:hypothetical protein [Capsulimonas corticalis]BDI34526.1 hypothetical protein CCAX7_65770 [Capsulimonas corticalis]
MSTPSLLFIQYPASGASAPPPAKPGDLLLFVRPHRLLDYVIKLFTLSRYYHVGIYAGDGHVLEARPKGVGRNSLADRKGGYVVAPAPHGKGAEALAWAETQIGANFDRWNMVHVLLEHIFVKIQLNIVPSGKYSCGELAATAFYHAGVRLFPDRDLDDIEPKDFARFLPKEEAERRPVSNT